MGTLEPATLVTILSVVVALFGVIVLAITVYEYPQLRALRDDFEQFKTQWRAELQDLQKALQRVIASYGSSDPMRKSGSSRMLSRSILRCSTATTPSATPT